MTAALADFDALGLGVTYGSFKVELTHPETGAPLVDENNQAAFIEIEGYNSDAGERLKKAALQRAAQQRKGFREQPIDLERARAENADALSQLTRSWHLVNKNTGAAIPADAFPCNVANARTLYARPETDWITKQVGAALSVEANFIKA